MGLLQVQTLAGISDMKGVSLDNIRECYIRARLKTQYSDDINCRIDYDRFDYCFLVGFVLQKFLLTFHCV